MRVPRVRLAVLSAALSVLLMVALSAQNQTEAPSGFSTPTDCPSTNLPPGVDLCASNGMADPPNLTFAESQETFEEQENLADGLGPIYNDKSCANCHQNPVTGGISQITEFRAGHRDANGRFVPATVVIDNGQTTIANRSLINDRAICPQAQERKSGADTIATFRTSLNILGDGFVEAIDSNVLQQLAISQCNQTGGRICGQFIQVPVLEAPGQIRGGRFGWKNQMASLLSFSSDAYLNEMGITNRLNPSDPTTVCKTTTDPEDEDDANGNADLDRFAHFMRATKAPPRDAVLAATPDAQAGQQFFNQIGCNTCHVASFTTVPPGTVINGGQFTVPDALGNKVIHPFSDFLLHNVGTGDGIVQNGPPETANKMRTPPLWGVRTRDRLMHDGESLTRNDAILRHGGEATSVTNRYRNLTTTQKNQLITFLNSL